MACARWRIWGWGASLVLLACSPYLGSLPSPLLHDDRTLLDNPWLREQAGAAEIFGRDYWFGTRHGGSDLYRPVTVLTLAWNLRAARGPLGLRATNLALHAAVTLLVGWTLWRVLGALPGPRGDGSGSADLFSRATPAWAGAALFSAHPLASEAVLLAVGRSELLAALFGLLAFGIVVGGEGRAWLRVALSSVLLAIALFSKESAAAWPLILLLWWVVARASGREASIEARAIAGWAGALGLFLVVRGWVVGWSLHVPSWIDNPLVLHGAATRIANAVVLHGMYLGKMVLPLRLSVDYGFDQIPVRLLLPWGLAGAVAVGLGWVAVAAALRHVSSPAMFLWAFVPAAFVVTGNVAFPIGAAFAERLAYLPLAGFCGLGGYLVTRALTSRRAVALSVALLLALAGAWRTARRSADFRDLATFVEATAAASPRSVKALANAGRTRLRLGRPADAVEPLETAVALWPEYTRALELLAEAYARLGERERAEAIRARAHSAAAFEGAIDAPLGE